jgi:hypothetical protein
MMDDLAGHVGLMEVLVMWSISGWGGFCCKECFKIFLVHVSDFGVT